MMVKTKRGRGSKFRVQSLKFKESFRFQVAGSKFRVQSLMFKVQRKFQVSGFRL
jgi:hypothetical protein